MLNESGRLLLVDDEETFRLSTADLLRLEGYTVDTAASAREALENLNQTPYDLIIADIQMPGNSRLEFIKALPDQAPGVPVILATGYPSKDTAIEAVALPVVAYLVKPVDLDLLKKHCRLAVEGMRAQRAVVQAQERMTDWQNQIETLSQAWAQSPSCQGSQTGQSFVQLLVQNILQSVMDLGRVTLASDPQSKIECVLGTCPRLESLKTVVADAIEVLEQTKQSFKSKQLFALRQRLESALKTVSSP